MVAAPYNPADVLRVRTTSKPARSNADLISMVTARLISLSFTPVSLPVTPPSTPPCPASKTTHREAGIANTGTDSAPIQRAHAAINPLATTVNNKMPHFVFVPVFFIRL